MYKRRPYHIALIKLMSVNRMTVFRLKPVLKVADYFLVMCSVQTVLCGVDIAYTWQYSHLHIVPTFNSYYIYVYVLRGNLR